MKFTRISSLGRMAFAALLITLSGSLASAQPANTVTIKYDDGDGITGELLEASDVSLRLDTIMGAVTIPFDGISCIGAACPDSIRFKEVEAPVVLTALDGSAQMAGNLIGIEDNQYVVASEIGEIRIDMEKAICEGAGCPDQPGAIAFGGAVVLVHGTTNVEGTLIGLEEDAYLIDTEFLGKVRVTREAICKGEGCPQG